MDKTSQQVTMQHHFLKCLLIHVRPVVPSVAKDYIPDGQGVELETKIEVEGELNRINVNDSKRRGKFNGNCNFCGIYGRSLFETFSRKDSDKVESFNISFGTKGQFDKDVWFGITDWHK